MDGESTILYCQEEQPRKRYMKTEKKAIIKVCINHEYKVPLIWTFAFIGAEYWCPYCGFTGGMFGVGKDLAVTETLIGRLTIYQKASKDFLRAIGSQHASSIKIENKYYKPEDLPQEEKDQIAEILKKGWEQKVKASTLMHQKHN